MQRLNIFKCEKKSDSCNQVDTLLLLPFARLNHDSASNSSSREESCRRRPIHRKMSLTLNPNSMKTQKIRGFAMTNTRQVHVQNKKAIKREGILTCVANDSAVNGLFQNIHGGRNII